MTTICASAQFLLPLFSLGYPEAVTILVSHTLPSPRAVIALLARGIGETRGFTPEQKFSDLRGLGSQVEARLVLQWAFESSSYAFSRPLSPLKRSSQIWRVIWLEKTWRKKEVLRDAVNVELVSLSKLAVYLFMDINRANELLTKYLPEVGEVTSKDVKQAFQIARLVGKSEMLATPISVEIFDKFDIIGSEGGINTYCPLDWLKKTPEQGLVEDVLVSLNFLSLQVKEPLDLPKYRHEKRRFVLPLLLRRITQGKRVIEYLEPVELRVEARNEYVLVKLFDGGKVILPKNFLGVN